MKEYRKSILGMVWQGLVLLLISLLVLGHSQIRQGHVDIQAIIGLLFATFGLGRLGFPLVLTWIVLREEGIPQPIKETRGDLLASLFFSFILLSVLLLGTWITEFSLIFSMLVILPLGLFMNFWALLYEDWVRLDSAGKEMFGTVMNETARMYRKDWTRGKCTLRAEEFWICSECFSLTPIGESNCWRCEGELERSHFTIQTEPRA